MNEEYTNDSRSENEPVNVGENAYAEPQPIEPQPVEAQTEPQPAAPLTEPDFFTARRESAHPVPQPQSGVSFTASSPDLPRSVPHYDARNGTYSYSRETPNGSRTNCCEWSNADAKEKKKTSANGFHVFAGVMLAVFAVSAAAIAGFTVYDHVTEKAAPAPAVQTPAENKPSVPAAPAMPVSSFADTGKGLSKAQVAAKCSPSAVGIVVDIPYTNGSTSYYDPFGFFGDFGFGFGSPYGNDGGSSTQYAQAVGSGFIYNADGYIITNHHVIEDAETITVYMSDKTTVEAKLIGSDKLTDIAVIKIEPGETPLVPMEIGNSDALVVGDEVIAIGCPAGIEYMGTVTDGIISAINRDVELTDSKKTMTLLQTNATINKGNSGGPLVNSRGEVIGINTLKLASNYEGIGFSIPINSALPIISQIMEYGTVTERDSSFVSSAGQIGIQGSNITESEAKYYNIPVGVLVNQIDKESAAAKAGLRRGDIITAYNGEKVTTVNELNSLKDKNKAGDEVTISVYRDGNSTEESSTFDLTFKLDAAS